MQDNEILGFFAKYIESELGIVYSEGSYFQLHSRLDEIATLMGVKSLEELYQLAQQGIDGSFKQLLLDLATNNETSFFRDSKVFKAIESVVLKAASENQFKSDVFRIWSAASSTGQEAISIAVLIHEYNLKTQKPLRYSILGTDVSERALQKASLGIYTQLEVQRGLPVPYLVKYFKKDPQDRWMVSSQLSEHIQYKKVNLIQPLPMTEKFQLVLCRNMLIYQNLKGKSEILKRISAALVPGGYLVLGSGETLLGLSNEYEQCTLDGAVLYRKKLGQGEADHLGDEHSTKTESSSFSFDPDYKSKAKLLGFNF